MIFQYYYYSIISTVSGPWDLPKLNFIEDCRLMFVIILM